MIDKTGDDAGPIPARRWRARAVSVAAAMIGIVIGVRSADAQDADYCARLRAAIAAAGQSHSPGAAYDAAAQKQRAEIDKTVAYANQIGCDRRKFLFFGNDPPAQCGEIYAQITRMQANLGQLQSRGSGGGGGRSDLVARYQSECGEQQRPRGFFDALFGNPRQEPSQRTSDVPLLPDPNSPDQPPTDSLNPEGVQGAHAGSKEVCVRTCDGYFFPIGYSGSGGGRSGDLQEMCKALCPNAEVALYSYPPSGDINEAVGADGTHYADLPNALRYRKSVDPTCSCRRRGQSWAQALADAEALLGERKTDIIVTQEKSDELARAKPDKPDQKPNKPGKPNAVDAAAKPAAVDPAKTPASAPDSKNPTAAAAASPASPSAQDLTPTDLLLGQQQNTVSRENSGIASGDASSGPSYSKAQGQTEEVTGPDGVKRRVRIIDPTL